MPALLYTAASTTYTARSTWAIVELWGGGGCGGGATATGCAAGGGAGGQYAKSAVTGLTPGTGYTVAIGQTRTGATTGTLNGNDSTFASTTVVAKGGAGAPAQTTVGAGPGASGSTSGGVGNLVVNAGGNGATAPASNQSGGGGGAAGPSGAGGNASGITAGTGNSGLTNIGTGGAGRTSSAAGNAGTTYGGAGGGAYASTSTDRAGGNGAAGYGRIYYSPPDFLLCLGCG